MPLQIIKLNCIVPIKFSRGSIVLTSYFSLYCSGLMIVFETIFFMKGFMQQMRVENIKLSSVLCLPPSSLNKIFSCLNLEERKICFVPLPNDWFLLESNFIHLIIKTISWSLYTFSIECFNPLSWNLLTKIYHFKSHGFVLFGGWISRLRCLL